MQGSSFQMYLYEDEELVYEDEEPWALYDPEEHDGFFADGYRILPGNNSKNQQYSICWSDQSWDDLAVPAGFCIVENGYVSTTVEIEGINEAEIANDGTVALFRESNQFHLFNLEGEELYQDSFEDDIMMVKISSDGEYAALSTIGLDNSVHMFETQNGQYLGQVGKTGESNIQHIEFVSEDEKNVLQIYDRIPNKGKDVYPKQRIPMGDISVESEVETIPIGGIAVISDSDDDVWHHVPETEVQDVEGRLRIPNVSLNSSCNKEIIPIDSYLIYDDIEEAANETVKFCEQCRESSYIM
jgi:hypothetical protein